MEDLKLTVDSIERREYFDAFHQNARRIYLVLAAVLAAVILIVIVATGNLNLTAFLGPMMIFCAVIVLLEIVVRKCYNDELMKMEPVKYHLGREGWSIQRGMEKVEFKWKDTLKVNFSRHCVFLYNSRSSSNMIPRRLLSVKEEQQIKSWFQAGRGKG